MPLDLSNQLEKKKFSGRTGGFPDEYVWLNLNSTQYPSGLCQVGNCMHIQVFWVL